MHSEKEIRDCRFELFEVDKIYDLETPISHLMSHAVQGFIQELT